MKVLSKSGEIEVLEEWTVVGTYKPAEVILDKACGWNGGLLHRCCFGQERRRSLLDELLDTLSNATKNVLSAHVACDVDECMR